MTTIAYRDGIMASDSLITAGDMRFGQTRKFIRTADGWLAGAAGDLGAATRFLKWVEDGRKRKSIPKLCDNFEGLVINPDGELLYADDHCTLCRFDAPFGAIGSGDKYALGAMEMGASAERAIEVAIKHDTASGGPIKTLRLREIAVRVA